LASWPDNFVKFLPAGAIMFFIKVPYSSAYLPELAEDFELEKTQVCAGLCCHLVALQPVVR
jgi:hypothetical protein